MTVSRKSPGDDEISESTPSMITKDHIYSLTEECYQESKEELQERSGYDVPSPEILEQKAIDEKLPGGSQTY